MLNVLITLSTSDTMRDRRKMSKNYSAHLPFAYPPRKSKSRSPLFDDPEIPRRAAPVRKSGSPTGSRRTPTRRPYTCTSPANSTKRRRFIKAQTSSGRLLPSAGNLHLYFSWRFCYRKLSDGASMAHVEGKIRERRIFGLLTLSLLLIF